jgi:hypothetical protein
MRNSTSPRVTPDAAVKFWNDHRRIGTDFQYFTPGIPSLDWYRSTTTARVFTMVNDRGFDTVELPGVFGIRLTEDRQLLPESQFPILFDVRRCRPVDLEAFRQVTEDHPAE